MASTQNKKVPTIKEKYLVLKDLEKGIRRMSPKTLVFPKDIMSKYETGQFGAKRQKLSVGKHDSVDKAGL